MCKILQPPSATSGIRAPVLRSLALGWPVEVAETAKGIIIFGFQFQHGQTTKNASTIIWMIFLLRTFAYFWATCATWMMGQLSGHPLFRLSWMELPQVDFHDKRVVILAQHRWQLKNSIFWLRSSDDFSGSFRGAKSAMVVLCMLKWALPTHALRPTKRDEEYSIIADHRPSCKNVHPLFVLSQASCETQIARKFIISTHSVRCRSHSQKFESHSQAMASLPSKEPTLSAAYDLRSFARFQYHRRRKKNTFTSRSPSWPKFTYSN